MEYFAYARPTFVLTGPQFFHFGPETADTARVGVFCPAPQLNAKAVPPMSTQVLEDFLDLEPFAAQIDRDPRTVRRWLNQPDGLPFTRLGNRILIHVPSARDWMLSRMHGRTRVERLPRNASCFHKSRNPALATLGPGKTSVSWLQETAFYPKPPRLYKPTCSARSLPHRPIRCSISSSLCRTHASAAPLKP